MKRWPVILVLLYCLSAWGAEVIPPAPERYFNDFANVTSAATANRLNQSLEDFEKQTSSQIVVAIYPKMQSDSSIEEYTVRVARAWKAGQKGKDSGIVLFVFTEEHKLYMQVGYGLEGAVPDALAKRIIDNEITPYLKRADFDGGLTAGVTAMMAAARGEYRGTGRTVREAQQQRGQSTGALVRFIFIAIVVVVIISRFARGGGRRRGYGGGWWLGGGGWGGGGWGDGGGGGWSGGGGSSGGFSGGGGSFGGGGAGGSW